MTEARPSEVVWVMGASGAGKETFARAALKFEPIRAYFGWEGRAISVSDLSLDVIAQSQSTPAWAARKGLVADTAARIGTGEVMLLKWQFIDAALNHPSSLKRVLPEARHRAIVLDAAVADLENRLLEKPWFDKDVDEIPDEVAKQMETLNRIVADQDWPDEVQRLDDAAIRRLVGQR